MNPIDRPLIEACKNGDALTVEQLLQQGANPNAQDDEWPYPTALHIAAENGHLKIITTLIQYGANPKIRDGQKKTALHYAVEKQYHDIAQYLLTQFKIKPNTKYRWIDLLFLIAAKNGDIPMLQLLAQHGADPHATDQDDRTALHYAVENLHHEATEYLISQLKLDPNHQSRWRKTPFLIATQKGDIKMLQLLAQHGANPHIPDDFGQTALHHALFNQNHDIARYLITELNLDPNRKDQQGRTPLMLASANGDIKIIQLLIQHGADPNTTDHNGQNALHYAAYNGRDEAAQYLITHLQLDPNTQDRRGVTPFLFATQRKDIRMLQLLVQQGANPNTTDHKGQTALHHALKEWCRGIAQYLITQIHINPNIQDHRGYTPFLIATLNNDIEILQLLAQHGADPHITDHQGRSALHYALEKRYHNIAQYLLTQIQIDPNSQDHEGSTPFLIATQNGDIKMLRLLIQHGANPYVTDQRGRTALHHAVKKYRHNAVEYLMTQLQLDPNQQDHDGNTPLLIATEYTDKRIANTLIQLGAHPHIPNHQGETPAAIASSRRISLEKPQPSTITL